MQTLTRPNYSPARSNPGNSQAVKVAVLALILFALSGLITGFAFGAFVHFSPAKSSSSTNSLTTTQQNTGSTTSTTKKANPVPLGWPVISQTTYIEKADGSTVYTIIVQATDQKHGPLAAGNPLSASGITCKVWLTKNANKSSNALIANNYAIPRTIKSIQNPFPGEVSGLNFTTSPQTQTSNAQGHATWKYTISQSVAPGTYYLMALTDWDGVHYNWSWVNIVIRRAE